MHELYMSLRYRNDPLIHERYSSVIIYIRNYALADNAYIIYVIMHFLLFHFRPSQEVRGFQSFMIYIIYVITLSSLPSEAQAPPGPLFYFNELKVRADQQEITAKQRL